MVRQFAGFAVLTQAAIKTLMQSRNGCNQDNHVLIAACLDCIDCSHQQAAGFAVLTLPRLGVATPTQSVSAWLH